MQITKLHINQLKITKKPLILAKIMRFTNFMSIVLANQFVKLGRLLKLFIPIFLGFQLFICTASAQFTATPKIKPEIPVRQNLESSEVSTQSEESIVETKPAKQIFGEISKPISLAARAIGSYAKGCLVGAQSLEINGPTWQVMRVSRNRNWGHPELISFLEDLAEAAPKLGWAGLMVGDLAQPRGGPMLTGHTSHQIGLDADIWLREMPKRNLTKKEREEMSPISMLKENMSNPGADRRVDLTKWSDVHAKLIRRAAEDERVARIFVSPAIKSALCEFEKGQRTWLRKIRPWWGHHYHFHVRIGCPKDSVGCENQAPPPPDDGCGKELDWWLTDEPWVPKKDAKPSIKKKDLQLSELPQECAMVVSAQ